MQAERLMRPMALVSVVSIAILAFLCRMMSVIRYEVVIHEMDPYFQYKSTLRLAGSGSDAFQSWFDAGTWYPLSRSMPISLYPGLMYTAVFFVRLSEYLLHIPISVLQACVFMGPVMSVVGTLFSFDIGCMIDDSDGTKVMTGLLSALFFSIIPGFIQRSVAGSYDNESNSITAMVIAFDLWLRACGCADKAHGDAAAQAPSRSRAEPINMLMPCLAALAYFYMTVSWGGYVFLALIIPLHVFICMLTGKLSAQLRAAFLIWETLGYLLVGLVWREHQGVFSSVIYLPGLGVLGLVLHGDVVSSLRRVLPGPAFRRGILYVFLASAALLACLLPILLRLGIIGVLSGRLLSFVNPTYAKKNNPIVASVAEHQPSIWVSFFFNAWFLIPMIPTGMYFSFMQRRTVSTIFLSVYISSTIWFTAVMRRMILMMAPAAALCGAYTISKVFETLVSLPSYPACGPADKGPAGTDARLSTKKVVALCAYLFLTLVLIISFTNHALFCAKSIYSSPSIVSIGYNGAEKITVDDFREAYAWLEHNTHPSAKIASWWDYGYQSNQMGNKTTVVDNLTRSDFWIGLVGAVLASDEATAWRLCKELNIDYMFVMFGGLYNAGDDIGKFLWPVRISSNRHFHETYLWIAEIQEADYMHRQYGLVIDERAVPRRFRDSLLYKMSYHRFDEWFGNEPAVDRSRHQQPDVRSANGLSHFEEVFSSFRSMVRIYKVKDSLNF